MTGVSLPTVRDCMTSSALTFAPGDDLFHAIDLLLSNHFAAAPVVDGEKCLLGMLTEKDCLRVLSNLAYDDELESGRVVSEYHSAIRVICEPEMDLFRVTEMFLATNFPLLPVVEDDRLVGVISRRDALRGVKRLRADLDRSRHQFEQEAGHQADRPRSIESMQRTFASKSRNQLVRLLGRKS